MKPFRARLERCARLKGGLTASSFEIGNSVEDREQWRIRKRKSQSKRRSKRRQNAPARVRTKGAVRAEGRVANSVAEVATVGVIEVEIAVAQVAVDLAARNAQATAAANGEWMARRRSTLRS
jgi:hypothetical protein